jgi:hypothetical protein
MPKSLKAVLWLTHVLSKYKFHVVGEDHDVCYVDLVLTCWYYSIHEKLLMMIKVTNIKKKMLEYVGIYTIINQRYH